VVQDNRIDDNSWVHEATLDESDGVLTLDVVIGPHERPGVDLAESRQALFSRLGAEPNLLTRVTLQQPPINRVLARATAVDGFGWHRFEASELNNPVTSSDRRLSNGLVDIEVNTDDGTFSLNGESGYGKLVDEGDLGDSYNYSPPAHDIVVDRPIAVAWHLEESGPVRGRLRIDATYQWPDRIDEATQQRVGQQQCVVSTVLELRADEELVRVTSNVREPVARPPSASSSSSALTRRGVRGRVRLHRRASRSQRRRS
jgi:hypothetical protein